MNSYVQTWVRFRFRRERRYSDRSGRYISYVYARWKYTTLAICDNRLSVLVRCLSRRRRRFTVEIPRDAIAGLGTAPRFAGDCDGNNRRWGWVPIVYLRPAGRNYDTDDRSSGSGRVVFVDACDRTAIGAAPIAHRGSPAIAKEKE